MQLKHFGSKAWLAPHMDRLLGDVAVLHSPFFGSGKLEYYARRRRLRARRKPLLLEARPGLPALLAAPGGEQGGQALLLRAPPAGRAERPCRAPGRLRVRPAAQQLLGKVGLLRTAAAAGTEQRAASAATVQRDRAAPGRARRKSSASWENTARRAVRSRSWCCWFSACSPGSASTHPVLRL